MMGTMKFDFLRILFVVMFIVTMTAGILGGEEEASIIARKAFVQSGENKNPIVIKGTVHFVRDDEKLLYEASEDIFICGCAANFALIFLMRKLGKKL